MVWSQAICDCINDWGRCCYRHEGNGGLDRNRERGEKRQGRILEKGKKEGGNVSVNGNLESSGGVIDGSRKEKKEEITEDERLRREDAEADRRMKAVFGPDAIYRQGDGYLGYQKMPRPTIVKELEIFATHEITSQPRKTEDMRVRVNDDVIKDIIGVQQAKADPIINTEDKASPVAKGSPFRMSFKDHEARRKQV
ncbi:hypothetical protein BGZ60DRAFT_420436 [Tricladium varicosporioides]|nr:hypothetical protein BGZ60DRAFT_420436 [Hymenoscyphus varicosporioides]